MKNLFLAISLIALTSGCVGPRTASVGHKYVQPIVTTNMVGTTTSYQVGGQPATINTTTNWSVISTPPVEKRTWRETVFGRRAPRATVLVAVPPFPSSGWVAHTSPAPPPDARSRSSSGGGSERDFFSRRSSLGQPNPRANLQYRSSGGLSRSSLGQPNPRANLHR